MLAKQCTRDTAYVPSPCHGESLGYPDESLGIRERPTTPRSQQTCLTVTLRSWRHAALQTHRCVSVTLHRTAVDTARPSCQSHRTQQTVTIALAVPRHVGIHALPNVYARLAARTHCVHVTTCPQVTDHVHLECPHGVTKQTLHHMLLHNPQ